MEGIFAEQFVLLVRQALDFVRKFVIKLPETLRRERLESHPKAMLALLRPTIPERMEFAGANVRFHLVHEGAPCAAGREIALDFSLPFRLVALGEPRCQGCLLLFREAGQALVGMGKDIGV
jgi:hypothetical protein